MEAIFNCVIQVETETCGQCSGLGYAGEQAETRIIDDCMGKMPWPLKSDLQEYMRENDIDLKKAMSDHIGNRCLDALDLASKSDGDYSPTTRYMESLTCTVHLEDNWKDFIIGL